MVLRGIFMTFGSWVENRNLLTTQHWSGNCGNQVGCGFFPRQKSATSQLQLKFPHHFLLSLSLSLVQSICSTDSRKNYLRPRIKSSLFRSTPEMEPERIVWCLKDIITILHQTVSTWATLLQAKRPSLATNSRVWATEASIIQGLSRFERVEKKCSQPYCFWTCKLYFTLQQLYGYLLYNI